MIPIPGRYIGLRENLYGESALVRRIGHGVVLVQFDNLEKFSKDTPEQFAVGWTIFEESDFVIFDGEPEPVPPFLTIGIVIVLVTWAAIITALFMLVSFIIGRLF